MDSPAPDQLDVVRVFADAIQETEKGEKVGPFDHDTVIADIGIDSISLMEIVGILEDRLDVVLADEDITEIHTIGDLERLIRSRRAAAGS